jgi:hypothetical protein
MTKAPPEPSSMSMDNALSLPLQTAVVGLETLKIDVSGSGGNSAVERSGFVID